MKTPCALMVMALVWVSGAAGAAPRSEAQQPVEQSTMAPILIRLDGRLRTPAGEPRTGVVRMVISLYARQDDSAPLWVESQDITLDAAGRYTIVAGSTLPDGLPKEYFLDGSARWLAVGVDGEPEDQRILFITAPYALKAREAETLAGRSAADFVLADSLNDTVKSAVEANGGTDPGALGTSNYIAKFGPGGAADTESAMYELGGFVGIGMTNPPTALTMLQDQQISWSNAAGTNQRVTLYGSSGNYFTVNLLGLEKLRVTPTGVGVGHSVPASILTLPQDQGLTWANAGGTVRASVTGSSANTLSFGILGSEKLLVNSSGNVGIGTSSPTERLEVAGSLKVTDGVLFPDGRKQTSAVTTNSNTAVGIGAVPPNTTGIRNTAVGTLALGFNTTGIDNTAVGDSALLSNQGGHSNAAVGQQALRNNTTGGGNVAFGVQALMSNTVGASNTAIGVNALAANIDGVLNVAVGRGALDSNTSAHSNVAVGNNALTSNTSGLHNTAVGTNALLFATASQNTAVGSGALQNTTTGENAALGFNALNASTSGAFNAAVGHTALQFNTTGGSNTAVGHRALEKNTQGSTNTAVGKSALFSTTIGGANTAVGNNALFGNTSGGSNVAVGDSALSNLTSGGGNIAMGASAGSILATGSSNLYIDHTGGASSESDTMRLGTNQTRAFIAGIRGRTTGLQNAIAVVIDSNGQLGTVSSSQRYKEDIRDMAEASRGLLQLRPVIYRYKQAYADGSKPLDYGLIAEEVAAVYPDLVVYDGAGRAETVQYHKLTPLLLNEVQKQHQRIGALEARIAALLERLATIEGAGRSAVK
jgi:hypothetical protein